MLFPRIKSETWKKKRYIVARDERGRFETYKRAIKGFTLRKAKELYKTNKTFNEDIFKVSLTNVNEFTDYSGKPSIPSFVAKVQAVVIGVLRDGQTISARSNSVSVVGVNLSELMDEAMQSFLERLSQLRGTGEYDAEAGEALLVKLEKDITVRKGYVYYKARR